MLFWPQVLDMLYSVLLNAQPFREPAQKSSTPLVCRAVHLMTLQVKRNR